MGAFLAGAYFAANAIEAEKPKPSWQSVVAGRLREESEAPGVQDCYFVAQGKDVGPGGWYCTTYYGRKQSDVPR